MSDTLRPPSLQVSVPQDAPAYSDGGSNAVSDCSVRSSCSTPTLRRKRFKMRRMRNVPSEREMTRGRQTNDHLTARSHSSSKEYLQLPSIEITPSSDEDAPSSWSSCSTPSASPRRKRFLLRRWLKVREKKEQGSESSSQQSSQQSSLQSSHEDDNTRFLTPLIREERSDSAAEKISTASNSNKSSPTCSPVLRKRSRSPTPQSQEGENMVEKGSDHSSDKSPSTPEQVVQRTYSVQSARSGGKNSKKSQSWYNHERQHILRVLSPTYKQRNEDFRKLFKQLPDTERLIVDYSCALQRDILLQGRLYLSENWICFYSNIFRWETLLTVRLKDICSMTKEKTARLIPNAIQVCTDTEKHFFTSFGARDRTYMMMFRLWQNALLEKPLCPKELWHFVHQCYGNELGLTSDDEDYVPPDDDFNTMGFSEEIPNEENEINNDNLTKNSTEQTKPEGGSPPPLHKKVVPNNSIPSPGNHDTAITFELPAEEFADCLPDGELLTVPLVVEEKTETSGLGGPVPSPSLDFNDNEDIPTELSDSSETHDEGEVQAFHEDLNGRQHINEVYKFSVDKLYDILFTESQFMSDFMEQRRFSDVVYHPWKKEEAGNQTRVILYTISLSNPLAPKTATVTETQTLYKASQESECYIIDAEVITHDVPYHDYFYTLNRYMLTRVAKNKCRLRVSTELRYRKQPWGLVKGFIEKNFWSGLEENFRQLEVELSKLEEIITEAHQLSPKAKAVKNSTVRRKKRPLPHMRSQHLDEALSPVTTPTDEEVIQRIKQVVGSTQTRHQSPEHHHLPGGLALYSVSKLLLIISFVICLSLVLLVFLNMMLFYKLWMLEYSAQSLTTWQSLRLQESKLPQTQMEWAQLLEAQQRYHDAELQKWREIIKSSVVLLDQMKDSLLNLQRGIGLRDYSSETEEKQSRYH
ncbi:GRAM domain-containing protein 1B isoform X5 [Austrofundulus limnaeus]|uniref:GRAM domain-containing protein 1B isoform X5 n=1 Tax=Austrofundulus limnaeus TaxID=52670 RepID=A0A2I4BRX9_AUSLI|nr:PREDICTED: GRAM domain-containing protein 1B isoform X5 [Austrofundulus limnaeus]